MVAVVPCAPGFVNAVAPTPWFSPFWTTLYSYAWFLSFGIAFAVYGTLMMAMKRPEISASNNAE